MLGLLIASLLIEASFALPEEFIAESRCDFPTYDELDIELAQSTKTPILFKNVAHALLGYDKTFWEQTEFEAQFVPRMAAETPAKRASMAHTQELIVDPNKELWTWLQPHLSYSEELLSLFQPDYTQPTIISAIKDMFTLMFYSHEQAYSFRFVGTSLLSFATGDKGESLRGLNPCTEVPDLDFTQVCVQEEGDLLVVPADWMHGACHLDDFNSGLSFRVLGYDFPEAARQAAIRKVKKSEERRRKREKKAREKMARQARGGGMGGMGAPAHEGL